MFLLSTMGLTHIIVDSKIAEVPVDWLKRNLPKKLLWFHPAEALDCHQCTGFYTGMLCGAFWGISWIPLSSFVGPDASYFTCIFFGVWWVLANIFGLFICGFAGSLASLWVSHYFTYLQARSIIDIGDFEEGAESEAEGEDQAKMI